MSVDEKERSTVADAALIESGQPVRLPMKKRWWHKPEPDLHRPFGALRWPIAGPALVCAVLAVLLFARVIDLGLLLAGWTITFNVNSVVMVVILAAGIWMIVPRALKRPQLWYHPNTIISGGVLIIIAAYMVLGAFHIGAGPVPVLDLGMFTYTLEELDLNTVSVLLLALLLGGLAALGSLIATVTLVLGFIWWGCSIEGFGLQTFIDIFTSSNGARFLREMVPPDWTYFDNVISPLLLTVQTAVVATLMGVVVALPLSILAARNTTPHPLIYNIVRVCVNTLRAVPSLILAMICITFVGLGPVAGAFGLGLHAISVLTKLYSEAIEAVKPQPIEALQATGANGLKRFRWGVFPQAFPLLASSTIYSWESNVRDSTVVAFVGGGGIGFILQANLSLFEYARVSVILIMLVLTVILLDRISDYIRSKII